MQCEERVSIQPSMAGVLELSDQEFKATMINTPRAVVNKVDSMQEQMGDLSREMEILKRTKKKY